MEDLQRGQAASRRYRNRRIGEFLKELDLAEGPLDRRAQDTSGDACQRARRRRGFETDDDRTWFRVRLPAHSSFSLGVSEAGGEQDTPQHNSLEQQGKTIFHRTRYRTSHRTSPAASPSACGGRCSGTNCRIFSASRTRPHFLATYLNPALKAGLVEMTLPDKPTSRNQRYRRTSAGEVFAQRIGKSRA